MFGTVKSAALASKDVALWYRVRYDRVTVHRYEYNYFIEVVSSIKYWFLFYLFWLYFDSLRRRALVISNHDYR